MKKLFLLLSAACLMASCSSNDDPAPKPADNAPLTVLGYFVANNNLDDELSANIGAMYDGLAKMTKPATFLVYWDGKTALGESTATHAILKYETDGKGNINGVAALDDTYTLDDVLALAVVAKEYTTQLSTDKTVMARVLKDMISLSPTERVGLVAGSHGSAWTNSIFTSRSFGQDGSGTDNTILIPDMAEALKTTGRTFDFLLFDACYMGSAEVCYEFRDAADYQIVSALEVPAYGFPYEEMMPDLYEGTVSGYQKVCKAYTDYYTALYTSGYNAWATVALVDSKEMASLAAEVKKQITTHTDALSDYNVSGLQEYGKNSGPNILFDMQQFVGSLNGYDATLTADFDAQLAKTVLYKGCLENAKPSYFSIDADNYCGLGMYVPVSSRSAWNTYFKTTDWFTVAGWNEVEFGWDF